MCHRTCISRDVAQLSWRERGRKREKERERERAKTRPQWWMSVVWIYCSAYLHSTPPPPGWGYCYTDSTCWWGSSRSHRPSEAAQVNRTRLGREVWSLTVSKADTRYYSISVQGARLQYTAFRTVPKYSTLNLFIYDFGNSSWINNDPVGLNQCSFHFLDNTDRRFRKVPSITESLTINTSMTTEQNPTVDENCLIWSKLRKNV